MRRRLFIAAIALLAAAPSGAAGEAPRRDPGVISEDTTWSGTVHAAGRTVVRRGATLTILPGTTVKFVWSDVDGNRIGDGELNVEGKLIARGTPEKMITFTSARKKPGKKDWTYVMLSMNRESVVEHCLFEYAFTGLQVHLSTAVIRDNIFRGNFEGLRFSTSDLLVEHNDFRENTYGIRYESRGSETTIARNDISANEYAFFPVVRSTSQVKIHDNAVASTGYNVKMGQQQNEDLEFRSNWWGSADPRTIEEGFFDRRRDGTLGRVLYEPFLTVPPEDAGRR
jgi:parallel beta-helix repeat protein